MRSDKSIQSEFQLTAGSMLYMKREIQADWSHAIPRVALADARPVVLKGSGGELD